MFKRIQHKSTVRVVACLAFLGAGALFFQPAESQALPSFQSITTYYSDGSFSGAIGRRIMRCNGSKSMTGTASEYYMVCTDPCDPDGEEGQCLLCSPDTGCVVQ
ncbi:hypothetical protein [Sorangium sp. So ce341]|uniref:hypothetical protein n=1 Tax=Sorangium sp. So ce341 TaxID=3133302 RepID=UPI003F5FF4F1